MRGRRPFARAFAVDDEARAGFVQVEVGQAQVGDFADAQPTAQHEDEHGAVAKRLSGHAWRTASVHGDKEGFERVWLNRAGQALPFAQEVAFGQDGAERSGPRRRGR